MFSNIVFFLSSKVETSYLPSNAPSKFFSYLYTCLLILHKNVKYFLMYFYDALLVDFNFPSRYTLIKFMMLALMVSSGRRFFILFKDFIFGWLFWLFYSLISANP